MPFAKPSLIAQCRGLADIADAVNLARTLSLEVAVRGGGHNVAGRATLDGGLMIDLSPMRGIHVDPKARTARAQGGITWASGRYVNYLDHDESGDPVAAAYGSNYRRLQALKAQYDPSNFFHMNQNIRPFS
jgi:FAD/FMN-containing dehydrogenase